MAALTWEWLSANLPVVDTKLYEALLAAAMEMRHNHQPGKGRRQRPAPTAHMKSHVAGEKAKPLSLKARVRAAIEHPCAPPQAPATPFSVDEYQRDEIQEANVEDCENPEDFLGFDEDGELQWARQAKPQSAPQPARPDPEEFWRALPTDLSQIRRAPCQENLAALHGEPLFSWATGQAAALSYDMWRGALSQIAALAGEQGRETAHAFSALDPARYTSDDTDRAYSAALESVRICGGYPVGYTWLAAHGFPLGVPEAIRSPADRLRAYLDDSSGPGEEAITIPLSDCVPPIGGLSARYLGDIRLLVQGLQALILWAGLGSGKTVSVRRLMAIFPRSVFVGARRSLVDGRYRGQRRLDGDRIECCLPSIHKIRLPPRDPTKPRILVLDEFSASLDMVVAKGFGSAPRLLRLLRELIAACDLVVVAGADITVRERDMLFELGVCSTKVKVVRHAPPVPWTEAVEVQSKRDAIWLADSWAGKGERTFISCTVRRTAKHLAKLLRHRHPGLKLLLLASRLDWVPPSHWSEYDVVVTSPVGGMGVSYDTAEGPPFQNTLGIFEARGGVLDWTECAQGLSRPRQSGSGAVHYYVETGAWRLPPELRRTTDITKIKKLERGRYDRGADTLRELDFRPSPPDHATEVLHALSQQVKRIRCQHQRENLAAWLVKAGCRLSIFELPEDEITAEEQESTLGEDLGVETPEASRLSTVETADDLLAGLQAAGKTEKVEEAKAVLAAPDLHRWGALQLDRRGEVSEPQGHAQRRFQQIDSLGAPGMTEEAVLKNAHGVLERSALLFAAVRFVEEGEAVRLALLDFDAFLQGDITRVESLGEVAHLVHRLLVVSTVPVAALVAPLRVGVLRSELDDHDLKVGPQQVAAAELAEACAVLAAWRTDRATLIEAGVHEALKAVLDEDEGNRDLLRLFGIAPTLWTASTGEDPSRLLGNLLKGLGLATKDKPTHRAGKYVHVHAFDMQVYDQAVALADRINRRLSGLKVEEPAEIGTALRGQPVILDVPRWRPGDDDGEVPEGYDEAIEMEPDDGYCDDGEGLMDEQGSGAGHYSQAENDGEAPADWQSGDDACDDAPGGYDDATEAPSDYDDATEPEADRDQGEEDGWAAAG